MSYDSFKFPFLFKIPEEEKKMLKEDNVLQNNKLAHSSEIIRLDYPFAFELPVSNLRDLDAGFTSAGADRSSNYERISERNRLEEEKIELSSLSADIIEASIQKAHDSEVSSTQKTMLIILSVVNSAAFFTTTAEKSIRAIGGLLPFFLLFSILLLRSSILARVLGFISGLFGGAIVIGVILSGPLKNVRAGEFPGNLIVMMMLIVLLWFAGYCGKKAKYWADEVRRNQ